MPVLDADFCTDLTVAEGGDTLWLPPLAAPACEPPDWASLLEEAEARVEEERGRAAVAELRREELRRSERDARAVADSLTRQLDTCRTARHLVAGTIPPQISPRDTPQSSADAYSEEAGNLKSEALLEGGALATLTVCSGVRLAGSRYGRDEETLPLASPLARPRH